MYEDGRGLQVNGAGEREIRAVDDFRERMLAMDGGLDRVIEAAESAPGCALLQVYAAILFLYAGTREGTAAAVSWLARAETALDGASDRERRLYDAAVCWSRNDNEASVERLEELTRLDPRDLVAAKACEVNYFVLGQHHQGERFLAHMKRLMPHNPDQPDLRAMYAFALDLTGQYREARAQGERAVEGRFACAWAHHALSHVAVMTGEFETGLAEQEEFLPTWTRPGPSIHGHNAWHLALLRLEARDREGVLQLFRDLIWGHLPESTGEQVDAISLLWRMELVGMEVDDAAWNQLADACEALAGEAVVPFVVAHHAYALARTARDASVERLRDAISRSAREQPPGRRQVWKEAGIPVVEAAIAWARRDAAATIDALESASPLIPRIGGSDAQDDIFRLTLMRALHEAGRQESAQRLLALFPGQRPAAALI